MSAQNARTVGPYGMWRLAHDFASTGKLAADDWSKQPGNEKMAETFGIIVSLPAWYNTCHGLELALKAFLRACGVSTADVVGLRHDVLSALHRAVSLGLPQYYDPAPRLTGLVTLINPNYKAKDLEYANVGGLNLYALASLQDELDRLLEATHDFCRQNTPAATP